jgi:hypothetical protein
MIYRLKLKAAAVALLLWPLLIRAEAGKEFAVSPDQVAVALRASGRQVRADQIRLLFSVRTRQPNAVLKLINMEPWQDGTQKAEIACANAGACLPFFVLIQSGEPAVSTSHAAAEPVSASTHSQSHDVHVGDVAVLTFEGNDSRITIQVVCVQAGDRGQRIKVASRDRKRFYQAEVVEPGVLKGIF